MQSPEFDHFPHPAVGNFSPIILWQVFSSYGGGGTWRSLRLCQGGTWCEHLARVARRETCEHLRLAVLPLMALALATTLGASGGGGHHHESPAAGAEEEVSASSPSSTLPNTSSSTRLVVVALWYYSS
jgi:hypothetical protein